MWHLLVSESSVLSLVSESVGLSISSLSATSQDSDSLVSDESFSSVFGFDSSPNTSCNKETVYIGCFFFKQPTANMNM